MNDQKVKCGSVKKITLNRAGCPECVPEEFTAEINCTRYGLGRNAVVLIRFRDAEVQKSTDYCLCRAVAFKKLPTYMDGKRTRVTFERVTKGCVK